MEVADFNNCNTILSKIVHDISSLDSFSRGFHSVLMLHLITCTAYALTAVCLCWLYGKVSRMVEVNLSVANLSWLWTELLCRRHRSQWVEIKCKPASQRGSHSPAKKKRSPTPTTSRTLRRHTNKSTPVEECMSISPCLRTLPNQAPKPTQYLCNTHMRTIALTPKFQCPEQRQALQEKKNDMHPGP
jgi:hypothetical protein